MQDEIFLIAGRTNMGTHTLYWKIGFDIKDIAVGDYAIVENANNFDLIQIVGFVKTNRKKAKAFSNTQYDNMKNVVLIIHKEELEIGKINNEYIQQI